MATKTRFDELAGGEQHGDELLRNGTQRPGVDTLGGEEHGPDTLGGETPETELLRGGEQHHRELLEIA
ncbi:MAG TPA: hypothetical protein VE088_08410 [Gaiellaceae bacterium]|nr:hypothetical protein [Gaiellaceae bacterium]